MRRVLLESLACWGSRAPQDHLASQAPLDPEALRVCLERSASRESLGPPGRRARLERMGRMDPQACQDPRETRETEGRTVCPDSAAHRVKLGSRAWLADLEKRERPGSQASQDSPVRGERKATRERKGPWGCRD